MFDIVICAGVEKMTGPPTDLALEYISMASDRPFEQWNGATLAALNALSARNHMMKYGTTEEELALVSVKNHYNAFYNPKAYFHKKISTRDVLESRPIATPLKLLDCSPICDGASSIVLSRPEIAEKYCEQPVDLIGSGEASDSDFVFREETTSFAATRAAATQAFSRCELSAQDMDFLEIHDAFSINEIIAYEDLGLCEKGKGGMLASSGETSIGGRFPVNTSGGLKAKGHPVGSSGIGQVYEVFTQLTGRIERAERVVKGASRALSHSMGGAGVTAQVHIFQSREAGI
jgi:acetyl-CoA C-acetyltransferase